MGQSIGERITIDRASNAGLSDDDTRTRTGDVDLTVHAIGVRVVELVIVNQFQMLVLIDVPVKAGRREATNIVAGILEVIVEAVVITGRRYTTLKRAAAMREPIHQRQSTRNCGINRRRTSLQSRCGWVTIFATRQRQEIDCSNSARRILIGEVAVERLRRKDQNVSRWIGLGQPKLFVVQKEKRFVA